MRVMKFGGTSVGDPARIANLCDIVGRPPAAPVVVVSAASKVTDMLLTAARKAADGTVDDAAIEARVTGLLRGLRPARRARRRRARGAPRRARAIAAGREATPEALTDLVASYGERISVRFVAATLRARGVTPWRTTPSTSG
jgi:aspartokinase